MMKNRQMTESRSQKHDSTADELAAARRLFTDIIPLQYGQSVIITTDDGSDHQVALVTARAASEMGGIPITINARRSSHPCAQPPDPIAAALALANVWVEYASMYILYSPAYRSAIDAGCRYICLPGMTGDMMARMIGRADLELVDAIGHRLRELTYQSRTVRIKTSAGTDISAQVDSVISPFDTPPVDGGGYAFMLAGQAGVNVVPETVNGQLVVDGAVWPPEGLGVLSSPLRLSIHNGRIIDISGGSAANVFAGWLRQFDHSAMFLVDHLCYGFHPGVERLTGNILEDERLFGCIEVGIGRIESGAPSHTDAVILSPTVWLDTWLLEEDGRYLDDTIVHLHHRARTGEN